MEKHPKFTRDFEGADNYMIERCRILHLLFVDDLAAFTAFSPKFTSSYAADWLGQIDAAGTVSNDEVRQDQLIQLTAIMDNAWVACRNKWSEVKFFMLEAFPTDRGVWKEFGADNYEAARKVVKDTIEFMTLLHVAATKYSAQLLLAGYTMPKIEEISTLALALQTASTNQKVFKQGRLTDTDERILTLNVPYNTCLKVCSAAQIIFVDSPGRIKQYVYMPTSHPAPTEFSGTVDPSATKLVGTISYVAEKTLNIINAGTTQLRFELRVTEDAAAGIPLTLDAGAAGSRTMATLSDGVAATKLVVVNLSEEQVGTYSVSVTTGGHTD